MKRDLEISFQSAIVLTKLCERHDAIGSNLPIVKPIKTAWDSEKDIKFEAPSVGARL